MFFITTPAGSKHPETIVVSKTKTKTDFPLILASVIVSLP